LLGSSSKVIALLCQIAIVGVFCQKTGRKERERVTLLIRDLELNYESIVCFALSHDQKKISFLIIEIKVFVT
jgi:hypothetical protein